MPSQEVIDLLWTGAGAIVLMIAIVGCIWFIIQDIQGRWDK